MSDELDLEAIRARVNAATPGPWEVFPPENDYVVVIGPDNDHLAHVFGNLAYGGEESDNAAFISGSREWVPALLDRIAELEREMDAFCTGGTLIADGTSLFIQSQAERIATLERQNAAAMAIVRAVADAEMGAAAGSPPHHLGLVLLVPAMEAWRLQDQARALVAGETREAMPAEDQRIAYAKHIAAQLSPAERDHLLDSILLAAQMAQFQHDDPQAGEESNT